MNRLDLIFPHSNTMERAPKMKTIIQMQGRGLPATRLLLHSGLCRARVPVAEFQVTERLLYYFVSISGINET